VSNVAFGKIQLMGDYGGIACLTATNQGIIIGLNANEEGIFSYIKRLTAKTRLNFNLKITIRRMF